jgi:hypothetical protein
MPTNALETLGQLQSQSLEALKGVQDAQLAALTSLREIAAKAPALPAAWNDLVELNTSFVGKLLEQQSAYTTQLVGLFTPAK